MDENWFASTAGIAAAAFFAGEMTKRWEWLASTWVGQRMPLVGFVGLYAVVGTLIGRYIMGTLEGDIAQLLVKSLTAAVLAVGARSAWVNSTKPLSESHRKPEPPQG